LNFLGKSGEEGLGCTFGYVRVRGLENWGIGQWLGELFVLYFFCHLVNIIRELLIAV
jgi:hypothetical protein